MKIPFDLLQIHPRVKDALALGKPVLALESTIISHGMPFPDNVSFAKKAEKLVEEKDVIPATIGILDGKIHVGLADHELEILASQPAYKTGIRDLSFVMSQKLNGQLPYLLQWRLHIVPGLKCLLPGELVEYIAVRRQALMFRKIFRLWGAIR